MVSLQAAFWQGRWSFAARALALLLLSGVPFAALQANRDKESVLYVGTSGTLTAEKEGPMEKAALKTLQKFIKEETGLDDQIVRQKDWRDLAEKMSKGNPQVGVFQGYEFAWAKEEYPGLKPLALAVNLHRYPVVYIVTGRDVAAKDFAGLEGKAFCLPDTGQPFLRRFIEKECQAKGKDMKAYFSKVTTQQSIEDCLDDVVDGTVQGAAVDRSALEAYKQRKPGRFAQLKEIAHSEPFPPVVISYFDKVLDDATLKRFKDGLFGATKTEKGKTILNLFHLTAFDAIPDDFGKVLADTRKGYPAPKPASK